MINIEWHPTYRDVCFILENKYEHEYYPSGYYYADETEGLNGPYGTAEAAKEALDEYVENFL